MSGEVQEEEKSHFFWPKLGLKHLTRVCKKDGDVR